MIIQQWHGQVAMISAEAGGEMTINAKQTCECSSRALESQIESASSYQTSIHHNLVFCVIIGVQSYMCHT